MPLVKPPGKIHMVITSLTGIDDKIVKDSSGFAEVAFDFIQFIKDKCLSGDDAPDHPTILLVAHNGERFDVPFLLAAMDHHVVLLGGIDFSCHLDIMLLSVCAVRANKLPISSNYKVGTMYSYYTKKELDDAAHRALVDVKATVEILQHLPFWNHR